MKTFTTIIFLLLFSTLKADEITCVTYNVNYSFINKKVVPYLEKINADIVCLQETNAEWETLIKTGLKDKYKHIEFRHSGRAGGLAVLSKYPITKIEYLKNTFGWFRSAVITIKKEEDTLQLLNVHLRPPLSKKGWIGFNTYAKAQVIHVNELKLFMEKLNPDLPTLILGDFNENDDGKGLKWLASEKKYTDALPLFDKRTETWRFLILRGRYDHIVFNNKIKCIRARVYKLGKSDHFPVFGRFEIN
ncbi:MAG: endonuclease/exonuclease/phosphatase family protein [Vicingaceae bacterium]